MNCPIKHQVITRKRFLCKREGLTIRGHIWKAKEGKLPAVILSHGFLANEKSCYTYAKVLAGLGYIAVTYDFCGGGIGCRSDGNSEDMTLLTEEADLNAVLRFVKSRSFVDSNHISLLGCSQGGFVSALAAAKHPEIERLLLFYPAFCIPDDARAGNMLMFRFDPENMPNILAVKPMKIGRCYAETVMDWDFREMIRGYEGQVLLLHGTKDPIVDIAYAREARECYHYCEYHEIENAGHGFAGKYNREAIGYLKDVCAADDSI